MLEGVVKKEIDETRQGEAFSSTIYHTDKSIKKFYIESYGCAMNFSDSEIVASILHQNGFGSTKNIEQASLILINTCSIREKAEQTVRKRLTDFKKLKQQNKSILIGVLGCMAERLKTKFLEEEKLVDIVVGPDAYRSLPQLIAEAGDGQKGVNVLLSREETYADIAPVRLDSNGISAFISIMRGCNNMCSFCVVPFTRGRERSRDPHSIVQEAQDLFNQGYREVTLLGQNVDSYKAPPPPKGGSWKAASSLLQEDTIKKSELQSPSFGGVGEAEVVRFAQLLELVSQVNPLLRVRFSTSHPKDITDEVLYTIAKYDNICNYIHLPVQSGNTRILELMNRTYTREWYVERINRIREIIPDCGISSDVIAGFCSETEAEHQDTLSIMEYCTYNMSYMYYYSERPGTLAERKYADDVPEETKKRRLQEIVELQNKLSLQSNQNDIGKVFKVLIEGDSKRSSSDWKGRSSQNKLIVFPKNNMPLQKGDYVMVKINDCTQTTLLGEIIGQSSSYSHL